MEHVNSIRRIGEWTEMTTSWFDHRNDYIQKIYVRTTEDGYLLTDDGDTLADLEMSGYPVITGTELAGTLHEYGVIVEENELRATKAGRHDLPQKEQELVQAVLAVQAFARHELTFSSP